MGKAVKDSDSSSCGRWSSGYCHIKNGSRFLTWDTSAANAPLQLVGIPKTVALCFQLVLDDHTAGVLKRKKPYMACVAPLDALKQHTESFVNELRYEASPKLLFYNLIERGEYPQEQGLTLSTFTIGRSLPTTDEPDFDPITLTSGETYTGACNTTYNEVSVGFFEKTFGPEKFGWKGPVVCQDDLIFSWRRDRFLDAYFRAMQKNVSWTVENRLAAIYDHFVPKAVAATDFEFGAGGTGAPGQGPDLTLDDTDCEITQEMLDATAAELIEEGATEDPYSDGWIQLSEQGPIFLLQIGMQQSAQLLKRNAELRLDYRAAFQGLQDMSPVIKRLGASRVIGNFRHLVVTHPPRYNYAGGTYVRVPTWVADASASKGDPVKLNPNWKTATHEGLRVVSPSVYKSLIVKPVNASGGQTKWGPKDYMGDWDFIIGGNLISDSHCVDPREKLGRHFAEYAHAPEPINAKYGRLIIAKRCVDDFECIECGS